MKTTGFYHQKNIFVRDEAYRVQFTATLSWVRIGDTPARKSQ